MKKACTAYSKIGNKSKQFVADALTKGRAMGVTDPFVCMSMFWEMHDGSADLKTDALQKHLIDTGWILEPFITVEDAVPLYYYYNIDEFTLFIKGEGNVFYQKLIEAQGKDKGSKQWTDIAKMIKPSLFRKDPNPKLVEIGKEIRTNTPYDYRTTLKAIVKDHKGEIVEKTHSYLYSTAVEKGLVHNKPDKDGKKSIKGTWVDKGWMMRKRCASQLAGIIAPGAAYSAEGKFGYANPEVLDKEHALFTKQNGHAPTSKDAEIVDVEATEIK